MRSILAGADRQRASAERHAKRDAGRGLRRNRPRREAHARRFPPSRYDRQRLYDEVWTEPTQQVAQRYGVSDVAIAKACALLDIPKPPRGYWAKKAAGTNCRHGPRCRTIDCSVTVSRTGVRCYVNLSPGPEASLFSQLAQSRFITWWVTAIVVLSWCAWSLKRLEHLAVEQ